MQLHPPQRVLLWYTGCGAHRMLSSCGTACENILVMAMAGYFVNVGLEYACALATVGMALGEISNLLVLVVVYKFKKKRACANASKKGFMRKRVIVKEIVKISIPVSFNRFITSIMSTVEFILIPRMLVLGGMTYQNSIQEYGKLTGMAMPLVFFPSLVTSALATTLVPAISEAMSVKRYKTVNYRMSKSIQLTFIMGFIFSAIFMLFPDTIGDLIYRKEISGIYCIFSPLPDIHLSSADPPGHNERLGKQEFS